MLLAAWLALGYMLEVLPTHGHLQEVPQNSNSATPGESTQGRQLRQLRQADLWSVPAESAQAVGSQPCPAQFDRMNVADVAAGAKPYVFGGDQRPTCQACKSNNDRAQYCRYERFAEPPICPKYEQERLAQYFVKQALAGSQNAQGLLELTPCDFWPLIQGRSLWLFGDSITMEMFHGTTCFFYELWIDFQRQPVSKDQSVIDFLMKDSGLPPNWEPWCAVLPQNTRICHVRVNKADYFMKQLVPSLHRILEPHDLIILNFGLWYNDAPEFRQVMLDFEVSWREAQKKFPYLMAWRETSPQHFPLSEVGDFQGSWEPPHFPCKPVGGDESAIQLDPVTGHLSTLRPDLEGVLRGNSRNQASTPVIERLGIPIMPAWNQSVPLWFLHHHHHSSGSHLGYNNGDCTHHCQPGMYQTWLYQLHTTLAQLHAHKQAS
ncbi:hypothetical protein WJX74_004684 [Apatococcus lobatus]